MTIIDAIARMEGFLVPGSRSARNHNPGDINWGEFAQAHGAIGCEPDKPNVYKGRFAVFPDDSTGFAALRALLQSPNYKGKTVREMLQRYAPGSDGNDVSNYESMVCKWVGCTSADIIDNLLEDA